MSLINDALKRATEAQNQAPGQPPAPPVATRPRGPKGVEDLPVPMIPAATRERPAWLPVVGIALLLLLLLGASGYFFNKWWKERHTWQPYFETPEAVPATNNTPAPKPTQVAKLPDPVPPPATKTTATNPPPVAVTPPSPPAPTNPPVLPPQPPPITPLQPPPITPPQPAPPPPATVKTNPVPTVTLPPVTLPSPVTPPPPVPPPVAPTQIAQPTPTNPPPASTTKRPDEPVTKVASVDFPDLKLQGIIHAKKKTTAIVNGKTLSLVDRIEGAFLLKIDQESVTFEKGSARRELFLLR